MWQPDLTDRCDRDRESLPATDVTPATAQRDSGKASPVGPPQRCRNHSPRLAGVAAARNMKPLVVAANSPKAEAPASGRARTARRRRAGWSQKLLARISRKDLRCTMQDLLSCCPRSPVSFRRKCFVLCLVPQNCTEGVVMGAEFFQIPGG